MQTAAAEQLNYPSSVVTHYPTIAPLNTALLPADDVVVNPRQTSSFYRFINLFFATLLFVALSPLILLGVVLVRLSGRGPILYRQTRMGLRGELFTIFKLRTMVHNAEVGKGAVWAKKGDERITPTGNFLRKTRIDELPQLWNVFRGDMNIIGPRPERPEFFHLLCASIPDYSERLLVKPGLTGWAQINNGYADSVDSTRLKQSYDMYYIHNQSYRLDFKILLKTIAVVLTGKGAH
jgi:lipopolysaccharide/colanic/teichoic acid biosynthesis glycosyltransferase